MSGNQILLASGEKDRGGSVKDVSGGVGDLEADSRDHSLASPLIPFSYTGSD